jgi:hypothetical protein
MQLNIFIFIDIYTDKLYGVVIPGILWTGDDFSFSNYFANLAAFPVAWQSEQNFG